VWGIDGQYDFVRATFAGDGNVPRIPPQRIGAGIYYRDSAWLARLGVLHAFRQDRIAERETETAGYTLVDVELAYTFATDPGSRLSPLFTIGIEGSNLLDDDVRNHVAFKKDEVLQPGRNVRIFGRIRLN
jgi:iron complex outermembrane receptor protein